MKDIFHSKRHPIYDPTFNLDDYELPIDSDFTFVGLIALLDPPRPEVPETIKRCHEAGIKVAMVTGDHPGTAVTIGTLHFTNPFIGLTTCFCSASMIGIVKHKDCCDSMKEFNPLATFTPVVPEKTFDELRRPSIEQPTVRNSTELDLSEVDLEAGGRQDKSKNSAVVVVGRELAEFTPKHWDWYEEVTCIRNEC